MATIHVTKIEDDAIHVLFGGTEGDVSWDGRQIVRPGDEIAGLSFDDLARRGVGPVEVDENQ